MNEDIIQKSFQMKIEKLYTLLDIIESEYQLLLEEYLKLKAIAQNQTIVDKNSLQ